MQRVTRLLAISLLGALLLVVLLPGTAAAPPPTVVVEPGKDSQVYRPETPGYLIKQNQDRVKEYQQVPAPPSEREKNKEEKPKEQEGDKK
jgi:hypothetical protein